MRCPGCTGCDEARHRPGTLCVALAQLITAINFVAESYPPNTRRSKIEAYFAAGCSANCMGANGISPWLTMMASKHIALSIPIAAATAGVLVPLVLFLRTFSA